MVNFGTETCSPNGERATTEEGQDPSKSGNRPRDSRDLSSSLMLSSCWFPVTLKFIDVSYKLKMEGNSSSKMERILGHIRNKKPHQEHKQPPGLVQDHTILNGITGMVSPGEILAVLGPSGSGKSTLLYALAGRLQGQGLTGTILANNKKLSKQAMRSTGFVPQDDVLYPHLTVRETLIFCSLLRLPRCLSKDEKKAVAESVISELGLTKCSDTIIGNAFIRGVSGGERKRVSIAHEMLVKPSLLILDEPTSGLDSTGAHRLIATLGSLAQKGKTIVTSVHQPSSRVYQMFDSVLVLSEGSCVYFGKAREAMKYLDSVGFSPSFPMNPADFLLDLANGVGQYSGAVERDRSSVKQSLAASYSALLAPKVKAACMEATHGSTMKNGNYSSRRCRNNGDQFGFGTWFNQFSILLQRGMKERKHKTFGGLRVFQVLTSAILAGVMWWRSSVSDLQDRLGLLFFMSIFWGVLPSFNAVFTFPQERAIFMKERASGMYTLSSYFMSRIVGDLPLELILPTVFLTLAYWMAGLKPELGAFLLTWLVLLGYVLVSQGLGLALGAAIMDAKQASTIVTVTMLAFVITGGYYVHKVPPSVAWFKYLSTTYYSYRLLINVQYGDGRKLLSLLGCSSNRSGDSCKFVEEDIAGQISPVISVSVLMFMFVGYRLLAYLALRRIGSHQQL